MNAAIASAALAAVTLTQATIITVSWLNAKTAAAIFGAAILAGTGTYLVQQRKFVQIDATHRALLSQQAQATVARDETLATLRTRDLEIAGLRKDVADLPRLRNEITQLRRENEATKQRSAQQAEANAARPVAVPGPIAPGQYIARDQLAFVGWETPESAYQSYSFLMFFGGYDQFKAVLPPEGLAQEMAKPKGRENFEAYQKKPDLKGLRIVARKNISEERVELKLDLDHDNPEGRLLARFLVQPMMKIGSEWRTGGNNHPWNSKWEDGTVQKFVP